ncbi:MAG: ABC transporter permease [Bacillota bacterium]|nr:ABC transporter permease [Bacillota bacterium]
MKNRWLFIVSLLVLGLMVLGGLLAPVIYPLSYDEIRAARSTVLAVGNIAARNVESGYTVTAAPPSLKHPMGTNHVGLDLLALTLWGLRPTLIIATLAMIVIIIVGTLMGLVAGYFGGRADSLVMGFCSIVQPFSNLAMLMFLLMVLSPGIVTFVLVLSITNWVPVARVVRGEVLKLKEFEFVSSAISIGGEDIYIAVRHIVPNLFSTVLALSTDVFSEVLLISSSLSFLGVNFFSDLSPVDLGQLVAAGYRFLTLYWWESILPGIALILVIISSNLLGISLERIQKTGKQG